MTALQEHVSADGVTGEYAPAPSATPVARTAGQGLTGLDSVGEIERREQARKIHEGEIVSVHSWELVTAVDGPGTRMTTFFAGCPLRCLYCHNPDTLEMRRGTMVPTQELCDRILRYKRIFARTGGGVTFSGGEPLMQPAGLARLLRFSHQNGIHTAIDTSGFLGWRCTDEMLSNLDLVLLDLKSGLKSTYEMITGQQLEPTLEFARRLAEEDIPIWARFVLVPGYTDAVENVEEVARLAALYPNIERVEVLPFHQMGRDKWDALRLNYQLGDVEPPSAEELERVRAVFRARGLTVY